MMNKRNHNLTFALKDGVPAYIDDVEAGLKCNCVCPACGEPLVAKKGVEDDAPFCALCWP